MIRLKGITKSYPSIDVLRGIDMEIPDGCIFGIIGKSGAGKSTLLRITSLLERPDMGEVYYDSQRVDTLSGKELLEKRRTMGMIFQNFNLLSSRNAAANIAYPLEIAGKTGKEIEKRVDELLEMVDIKDKRKARMSELSGGQKQRVAIARALAANPQVLFCDEATSSLDPQTTRSILSLIRDLHSTLGITVFLITHQMEVIHQVCQQVVVLEQGLVVESGTVSSIFDAPKSQAAKDLVNAG
jgi:D-methionine transport system ATP-binding protein